MFATSATTNGTQPYFELYYSKNALHKTVLADIPFGPAPNPFQISETQVPILTQDQQYTGLPVINADIAGVQNNGSHPYFYIDFNANQNFAWNRNCTQAARQNGNIHSCTDEPTYTISNFYDSNVLDAWIGTNDGTTAAGFVMSGEKYTTVICISGKCRESVITAVDFISEDNLLYDFSAAYGILGYGPQSDLWWSMINPETQSAVYSIAVNRLDSNITNVTSAATTAATGPQTNITLGGLNPQEQTYYSNQTSVNITTDKPNEVNYTLSRFDFGVIYYDDETAQPDEQYFQNLTKNDTVYKLAFDMVTQGMSLPTDVFN